LLVVLGGHFHGRFKYWLLPGVRSRWLDIDQKKEKEQGQYPALLYGQLRERAR